MTRSAGERLRDVRRLVDAACAIYRERARYVDDLVRTTGLSPEGVALGFESLEREPSEKELRALVAAAGDAERVHVVLSANVFVAPLRAMALARAAAPVVTVRPSARDPVLAEALVREAGDPGLALARERDVARIESGEIHVYGRDATTAAVRARARPGVKVRAHGAGMGVAFLTAHAAVPACAEALARDVAAFDQRGCLSPRVVLVEGNAGRARSVARALHESLARWGERVPRGAPTVEELRDAAYWRETVTFVGQVLAGPSHVVALVEDPDAICVPPAGRHVLVVPSPSLEAASHAIAPLARYVVVVGSDDRASARAVAPVHARVTALGEMQRPPLDGPVDGRSG